MANTQISTMLATTADLALTACGGGGGGNNQSVLNIRDFKQVGSYSNTAQIVSLTSTQSTGEYRSLALTNEPDEFSNGLKLSNFDPQNLIITSRTSSINGQDITGHTDFEGTRYLVKAFVYDDQMAQIIFAEPVPAGTTWENISTRQQSSISYPIMPSNQQNGFVSNSVLALTTETVNFSMPRSGNALYTGRMVVRHDDSMDSSNLGINVDFGNQTLSFSVDGNNDSYTLQAVNVPINLETGSFSSNNAPLVVNFRDENRRSVLSTITGEFNAENGRGVQGIVVENGSNPAFFGGFVGQRLERLSSYSLSEGVE